MANDKKNFDYKLQKNHRPILSDCSGVTYCPETKTFFVIENFGGNVFEINSKINILNVYPTNLNKADTEGITYAGNGIFYICGEKENMIYKMQLKNGKFNLLQKAKVKSPEKWNKNLEGIAFCKKRNALFCVKEKHPPMLMELSAHDKNLGKIKRKIEIKKIKDLSGIAYCENKDLLFLLSDESKCVLIYDIEMFKEVARFPVTKGKQPEGICFGKAGEICIISEPTDCYFYKR